MPTVTFAASIFMTNKGATSVAIDCPAVSRAPLVFFGRPGHKERAAEYIALVSREFVSPVRAVRALVAAEQETMAREGIKVGFIDELLGLMDEAAQ